MRILVIGGTRFVGPRLVRALLARGHRVATFNRGHTPDELPGEVERLHGDRSDPAQLARALAGKAFDVCVDTIAMRGATRPGHQHWMAGRSTTFTSPPDRCTWSGRAAGARRERRTTTAR